MTFPLLRRGLILLAAGSLLLLAAAPAARGQLFQIDPNQPDMTLDGPARKEVLEGLVRELNEAYVFPEKAISVEKALRRRLAAREYDGITSARAFADSLTAHLQAVTHDRHLGVRYSHRPIPEQMNEEGPTPEQEAAMESHGRKRNFGFERVERLPGNVGYLELRQFAPAELAGPLAEAAMNFLANSDALIVDLRRNGGGDGETVALLCSYLLKPHDRRLLNTVLIPREKSEWQSWTVPSVPGARYPDKPVYVLTGEGTFSAAEEFAYNLQSMKRAKTVGARSGGGAHPVQPARLTAHFGLSLPFARSVNPETKTNWEGVGVQPDVPVEEEQALAMAHRLALEGLLAQATNPEERRSLEWALNELKMDAGPGPESGMRRIIVRGGP